MYEPICGVPSVGLMGMCILNFDRYFQVCELLKEDGEFKVKIYTHEVNNTMIIGHRFRSMSWKLDM